MKKRRYKSNLLVLGLLFVIGTTSVSFFGAQAQPQEVTITVFDHATDHLTMPGMYDYAKTTITIPCFEEILSCRMEFEGYCDLQDDYPRCLRFFIDGNFTTDPMGIGGHIGVTGYGDFNYGGYGVISPGQQKYWEFDMSNCQLAIEEEPYGHTYINFIPYFSPGEHTIQACITSEPARCGDTYDTWISITLVFELMPCVEGPLFSDAIWILPVAILASSLMVLHQRRKH